MRENARVNHRLPLLAAVALSIPAQAVGEPRDKPPSGSIAARILRDLAPLATQVEPERE